MSKETSQQRSQHFARDEEILKRYEQLIDDDDEASGLLCLAEAINENSHPALKEAMQKALAECPDPELAYQICQKAAQKNGQSGLLQLQLGELAVALDQPADAAAHFERAQALGESGVDLYQLWGASAVALGQADLGRELFETALELTPDRVSEVYSAWGKALCDAGHLPEARQKLQVAIAADGNAFYPHAYMGVAYLQEKNLAEARESFQKALALLPRGFEAYGSWIVLELVQLVEQLQGIPAALTIVLNELRLGRYSSPLFTKLRQLEHLTLGPSAKHFVLVVAGEDEEGDYYEECEVDADNESAALDFVRQVHPQDERERLVIADCKIAGRPTGTLAGLTDLSEKTRVPTWAQSTGEADDDEDDDS